MNDERRRRRLRPWMIVLLVLAALLAYMYWPAGPIKIIISRETTYIDGPVNPDGTVNYVAYLDANYSKGVTPENNAAPLLLRAFGPDMLPTAITGQTLARLGLPADIFDRDKHFVEWKHRSRPGKAGATKPAQPGQEMDANQEDQADSVPAFDEVLAGQIHPDLEAWLTENAGPLDLVRQAAAKERFYLPRVSTSTPPSMVDVICPYLQSVHKSAQALTLCALLKAKRNDLAGAWDDVLAAHRLARLMGQGPTLIEQLIAIGMESFAAKAGTELATRYPMSAEMGKSVLGRLAGLKPFGDIVSTIDQSERFFSLDAVMMISRGGGWRAFTSLTGSSSKLDPKAAPLDLDYNQMLRGVNSWYDRMVKPLRIPLCKGRGQACDAFGADLKEMAAAVGTVENGVVMLVFRCGGRPFRGALTARLTDIFVAIMMPSLGQAVTLSDRTKASSEIEIVAAALAGYHAESGRWPADLKELCPSLLKTIPVDRFSGKPLIYKPSEKGYLLYSINDNLRDDGGQMDPHSRGDEKKDDIVAEVKPAEAASKPVETKPAEAASKPAQTKPADAKPAETSSRPAAISALKNLSGKRGNVLSAVMVRALPRMARR